MFSEPYEPSTGIPYLELFVQLLQAYAWPLAFFVLVLLFSDDIKRLIPSIRKVGPHGIELGSSSDQQELNSGKQDTLSDLPSTLPILVDPVANRIEENNRAEIARLKNSGVENVEEHLLRALTNSQLHKNFALVYSIIFGSQIRALRMLNAHPMSRDVAEKEFEDLKAGVAVFEKWSLDDYLKFMFTNNLIEFREGSYFITETGRSFLIFLTENRLSESREL